MKILTIAIPTYNRSAILKKSLLRLMTEINGIEDKITVLISDNNSEDETKQVVSEFSSFGIELIYNRNNKNLGPDGNFIYCFKRAKTKYVWLLGDDDLIKLNGLKKIVQILDNYNPGLIHLSKTKRSIESEYSVINNTSIFISKVSFWITFISSNIVDTSYVNGIDFNKFESTYMQYLPVYLNAIKNSSQNIYVHENILEDPLDQNRNGGYNIFKVFSINYLKILKLYRNDFGILWYEREKFRLNKNFFNNWIRRLIRDKSTSHNFQTNNWLGYLIKNYWYEPYFYFYLLKIFLLRK